MNMRARGVRRHGYGRDKKAGGARGTYGVDRICVGSKAREATERRACVREVYKWVVDSRLG